MLGPVSRSPGVHRPGRHVVGRPTERAGRHVRGRTWWGLVSRGRETGAAAVEFALLTTLLAGITVAVTAIVGSSLKETLELLLATVQSLSDLAG